MARLGLSIGLDDDEKEEGGLTPLAKSVVRETRRTQTASPVSTPVAAAAGEATRQAAPAAAPSLSSLFSHLETQSAPAAPAAAASGAPALTGLFTHLGGPQAEAPAPASAPKKREGLDLGGSVKKGLKGLKVTWDFLANKLEKSVTGSDEDTGGILARSVDEYQKLESDPRIAELVKKGNDAPNTGAAVRDMLGYALRNPTMIANFVAEQVPGAVVGGGVGGLLASPLKSAAVGAATRAGASATVAGVVGSGVTGAGINTGTVAFQSLGTNYVEGLSKYDGDTEAASEYAITKTASEVPANAIAGAFLGLAPFTSKLANLGLQGTIQGAGGAAGAAMAAKSVGEDIGRGELILEFLGEFATAPIDILMDGRQKGEKPESIKDRILRQAQSDISQDETRQRLFDRMADDGRGKTLLAEAGIQSADDPAFQTFVNREIAKAVGQQRFLDSIAPVQTPEQMAETRKTRQADLEQAFGQTASTGTGVGTGATEPVIQRSSVTPNEQERTLEGEAKPVILPEGKNTPAGTVAMSPEDLAARKEGFEVMPAFTVGGEAIANRFVTAQQAETFLFGTKDKKTGQRTGGYASSVEDMEFRVRKGKRSAEAGGGFFYFVEGKERPAKPNRNLPSTNVVPPQAGPTPQAETQTRTAPTGAAEKLVDRGDGVMVPASQIPKIGDIDAKANEAATSPLNALPQPTDGQKAAGNYKKGQIKLLGLDIAVENPRGSERSGTDASGKAWRQQMQHHYGYVKGSRGNDKDQVDVFIGPNPNSSKVFVVDQVNPDGSFDEHKAMLGFDSAEAARAGYLANYEPGWQGLGAISEMPAEAFKSWVKDGQKKKPLALPAPQTAQTEQSVPDPQPDAISNASEQTAATAEKPAATAVAGADLPAAERRQRKRTSGDRLKTNTYNRNPFLAFIGKHGINLGLRNEFSPDSRPMISGYGPMFRRSGLPLDELAIRAAEEGYLPRSVLETGETTQLYEMISALLRGTRIDPVYGYDSDTILEQRFAEEQERQSEIEAEQGVLAEDDDGYAAAERAAIQATDDLADPQVFDLDEAAIDGESNISTADAMRALGFTEQEIQDELAREAKEAQSRQGAGEAAAQQTGGSRQESAGEARAGERTEADEVTAPKETVEQKLKAKAKKAKATKVEEKTQPAKRDADQVKADKNIGKNKVAKTEVIELWEDNDDGKAPHVAWASLSPELQQDWTAAVEDGYATIDLHDRLTQTALKNARAERMNAKVQRPADEDDAMFRVTSGKGGMEVGKLQEIVEAFRAAWANMPDVVVVASEKDLPAKLYAQVQRAKAEGLVSGSYWNGKVYMVARNISDLKEAVITVNHEVAGHFGLRATLGAAHADTMRAIYAGHAEVRRAADAMMVKEGLDLETAVEEVLADFAESGKYPEAVRQSVLKQIYTALRKVLREVFNVAYVSDAELREIVANARRFVEQGGVEQGEGGTKAADASMVAARAAARADTPTFYSALERAFRANKTERMPASQWKSWLASKSKDLGVKKEEIEWVGVNEWLDLKGNERLTKEQVLQWIAGNRVYVNEALLTDSPDPLMVSEDELPQFKEPTVEDKREFVRDRFEYMDDVEQSPDDMTEAELDDTISAIYGMQRFMADHRRQIERARIGYVKRKYGSKHNTSTLTLPGQFWDYSELVLFDPTVGTYKEFDDVHFGDITKGKTLGWLRMNVRTDLDGNPVLFLEELQSQRGQDARKYPGLVPKAPFTEDTRSWTSLLLKRAIAYAQSKGIDRVAWTRGEQQNDRYSLVKRVDTIFSGKNDDGTWEISGTKGGQTVLSRSRVPEAELPDVVGKEAADAMIASGDGMRISGDDLAMMDADLRPYYDQTVPSVAKEILKKFGGTTQIMQIASTGEQIGFVIPESLQKQVEEDGLPMFRRKDYESQFDDLDPKTRQMALDKGQPTPPTIRERLDALRPKMWLRVVQGMFDPFRPVRDIDNKAYMQLRMSNGPQAGAVSGLLHYGQVFDDDGALNIKKGTKGLIEILQPVGKETDRFLLWIAANRAGNLAKEERELYFKADEIAALKRLNLGTMKDGRSRAAVYAQTLQQMNELNRSVLDVAKSAGLIDEAALKKFAADVWYVPFYRQMDDDRTLSAAQTASGSTGQYMSKTLKGSERALNDLMENVLLNWSHILSASMKNKAANATMDAAQQMGSIVRKLDKAEKGSLKTMVNGKEQHWAVEDEFLFTALSGVANMPDYSWFTKLAREFKTTFTRFISLSPTFKINNLIRDSVQAVALSELEKNPVANALQGYRAYKDERAEALVGGGLFAMGNAYDGDQATMVKKLIKAGASKDEIITTADQAKEWLRQAGEKYDEVSDAMENANRLALYQQLRSKGASHLEAAYAARDLQDFSLQGSWHAIRWAAQVLPYFNARLQGMYKLGRDGLDPVVKAMSGNANESQRQKAAKFGTVLAAVVTVELVLYLSQMDDDDWKKREEWEKDAFWWFKVPGTEKAIRIPKPFEMGAIGTVIGRAVEQMVDSDVEGKVFGKRLLAVLADNLAINPIPQMVRPIADLSANKDGFTDRPIESMGMERLSKENRVNQGTSAAAVAMNKVNSLFADFAEAVTGGAVNGQNMQLSPIQYDYLLRGYLGWMGTVIQSASNMAVMPFKEGESSRYERIDDFLVVGNYVRTATPSQSRWVTSFYENAKEMATLTADMQAYRQNGEIEKAIKLAEEKGDKIALNALYTRVQTRMSDLTKRMKMIEADTEMSGDEKRTMIESLQQMRIELARNAEQARIEAGRER